MSEEQQSKQKQVTPSEPSKSSEVLLLLKSKTAHICNIESNEKHEIKTNGSFLNTDFEYFCVAKNVEFRGMKAIGFEARDICLVENDILFGISRSKIGTLSNITKNKRKFKIFNGDLTVKDYYPVHTKHCGLTLIGGRDIDDKKVANNEIISINFNGNSFTKQNVTKLPYSARYVSGTLFYITPSIVFSKIIDFCKKPRWFNDRRK